MPTHLASDAARDLNNRFGLCEAPAALGRRRPLRQYKHRKSRSMTRFSSVQMRRTFRILLIVP